MQEEKSEEHEQETEMKALQLSLRISGLTSMKSIKMWGMVGDKQVAVPIGCGASHNFISSLLVKEEELQVESTLPYTAEVGDERKIRSEGVCTQLELLVQGLEIKQDLIVFELGGVDTVLGMEWLSSLDDIRAKSIFNNSTNKNYQLNHFMYCF